MRLSKVTLTAIIGVTSLVGILIAVEYGLPVLLQFSALPYGEEENIIREHLNNLTFDLPPHTFLRSEPHNRTYIVPNIVHYIWFNSPKSRYRFDHMIGALSVHKVLRPDVIYFHCDVAPSGPYWETVKRLPSLKVKRMQPPRKLKGEKTKWPAYETSDSNIGRVKVLLEHGGIYLDTDVIVTRPLDEFRLYPATIGWERENTVCGGVIIGAKSAPFLYLWLNSYLDDYRVTQWAYKSGVVPSQLARRYPELVHVVPMKFHRPNTSGKELNLIWGSEGFKWWENYTVHLWYRKFIKGKDGVEPTLTNIKWWPGAFGEMCRYMLYDELPDGYESLVVTGDTQNRSSTH